MHQKSMSVWAQHIAGASIILAAVACGSGDKQAKERSAAERTQHTRTTTQHVDKSAGTEKSTTPSALPSTTSPSTMGSATSNPATIGSETGSASPAAAASCGDAGSLNAGDQSSEPRDIELTRNLRKALMDDDSISSKAKNVTIITVDGLVTLRGEVKNPAEKQALNMKAADIAGAGHVRDCIEVND